MKNIYVYNSLSNKKELFKPIKENSVSIYFCGPTVYDFPHIGNCRPPVVFDLLRRLLLEIGYEVNFVSNFTDVDDKIIKKAIEQGKTEKEISEFFISEYKKVLHDLNVMPATKNPKVTENMTEIVEYIDNLVKTNHAYVAGNDVYFRVSSVDNYGQLANIQLDELKAGARIKENEIKENPFDFTLWKKTKEGITFPSNWGDGRPGWHTECCVMINNIFGDTIDIHGGGFDLKFPHHENEIAQNYATCSKPLANYWMHNGFINFNNEKMSKSLGNVINARDFINQYGGLFTRYLLLTTYYRAPLNISDEVLVNIKNEINKISSSLNSAAKYIQLNNIDESINNDILDLSLFIDALCDDLNISNAMVEVFKIVKEINLLLRNKEKKNDEILIHYHTLLKMLEILGLKFDIIKLNKEDIELLNAYNEARINKDFSTSDILRAKLLEKGLL